MFQWGCAWQWVKSPAAGLHPPAASVGTAASVAASVPGAAVHVSAVYSTPDTAPLTHATTESDTQTAR